MKSFEEYQESVYRKRDEALKRRKTKIRTAVTVSLCAALIVPASIAAASRMQNNESLVDASAELQTQPAEHYEYLLEVVTYADTAYSKEQSAEENLADSVNQENFAYDSAVTEIAIEGAAPPSEDGEAPDADNKPALSCTEYDDTDNLKSKPDYTQEEIIEAAYSALTDEEKNSVSKSDAMVNIEHHMSGEENYIVMFTKNGGGFIKVKLDAVTLEVRS